MEIPIEILIQSRLTERIPKLHFNISKIRDY